MATNHLGIARATIDTDPTSALNRLLRILCRSLPMYLRDARPWTATEDDPAQAALDNLAADQQRFARRVAEAILDQGGSPEPGPFPLAFASMNDAALAFLLSRVIERERRDLPAIQRSVADLAEWPVLRGLAEESLGNAQAHLDILERIKEEG
jgi:hypothetical protein